MAQTWPYDHTQSGLNFDLSISSNLIREETVREVTNEYTNENGDIVTITDTYYYYEIVNLLDYKDVEWWEDLKLYLEDWTNETNHSYTIYQNSVSIECDKEVWLSAWDDNFNYTGLISPEDLAPTEKRILAAISVVDYNAAPNDVRLVPTKHRIGIVSKNEPVDFKEVYYSLAIREDRGIGNASISGKCIASHPKNPTKNALEGGYFTLNETPNASNHFTLDENGEFYGEIAPNFVGDGSKIQPYLEYIYNGQQDELIRPELPKPTLVTSVRVFPVDMLPPGNGEDYSFSVYKELWPEKSYVFNNIVLTGAPVNKEIRTAEDLFNIRYAQNRDFTIEEDIDLSDFELPSYVPYDSWERKIYKKGHFPPIRYGHEYDNYNYISLRLNGNNHVIKNLTFKNNEVDIVGLFALLGEFKGSEKIEVKNLNLESIDLEAGSDVGGLAGALQADNLKNIEIKRVQVTGVINAESAGGIVGQAVYGDKPSRIELCSFIGEITSNREEGWGEVGGIVGYGEINIHNCYAKATLTGDYVGGICGDFYGNPNNTIENCYFVGEIYPTDSSSTVSPIGGYNDGYVKNCYYNNEVFPDEVNIDYPDDNIKGRKTEEMTYPHDQETTFINWNFEDIWGIREFRNEGYPSFNPIEGLLLEGSSNSIYKIFKWKKNYYLDLKAKSKTLLPSLEVIKWFPIIRTDMSYRENNRLHFGGTLINPGPYDEELWNGQISGYLQYAPKFADFKSFSTWQTIPQKLPVMKYQTVSANLVNDILSSDREIELESMPNEFQLGDISFYNYAMITDGDNVERIGYAEVEGNNLKQVDRGILGSRALDFSVGDTVYISYLEGSLSWDDSVGPVGKRSEYRYRAAIEVDTNLRTTGKSVTFDFFGGEMISPIDESESFEDLGRGELFIDARDLEFEDELFDRAKLKFDEMEFETWNLDEFKDWTWEEFKDIKTLQFSTMTLAELIKIAVGITDYTERDLINNYSREEIEKIIREKLDIVTAAEINSWDFDVSKLVARLITGEPSGAYDNWTEREIKDFLITMLTNEFSFADFEENFPFDKWEQIMKSRLEFNINNNASIEVEYNQYGPYNYMIDFQLGDIIIVDYPDVFRAMIRIIEVKEEFTQEGKKFTLTLGKEFETLITKLKADEDSISGRL